MPCSDFGQLDIERLMAVAHRRKPCIGCNALAAQVLEARATCAKQLHLPVPELLELLGHRLHPRSMGLDHGLEPFHRDTVGDDPPPPLLGETALLGMTGEPLLHILEPGTEHFATLGESACADLELAAAVLDRRIRAASAT